MRVFLVKSAGGSWFSHVSPGGRHVFVEDWTQAHIFREENYSDAEEIVAANPGASIHETAMAEPKLAGQYMNKTAGHVAQKMNLTAPATAAQGAEAGTDAPGTELELSELELEILRYAMSSGGSIMPVIFVEATPDHSLDEVVNAVAELENYSFLDGAASPPAPNTVYELTTKGMQMVL